MSDEMSLPRGPSYRVHRQRGVDAGTQRLMYIAGGLTGALMLIVLLWSSVGHHSGGAVPVVQADQRPVRVKPVNPGGMQIPGLNADVGAADAASGDTLAPAPETPDPAALATQTLPPAPVAASAPIVATVPPVATPVPAQPKAVPALTPPVPEHRVAKAEPTAPAGHQAVQLAALTSEAAAQQEWDRLAKKMPGLFNGHRPLISKFDHDGHTLWRLRTSGFATEAAAKQFCQDLRAKGAGCAVASF